MPNAPRRKVKCDESMNRLPSSILTNSSRTSRSVFDCIDLYIQAVKESIKK